MKKIRGTKNRPRLVVFRSNKSIYAQVIDDELGKTLAAGSEKDLQKDEKKKSQKVEKRTVVFKATKIERARLVGKLLAKKALKKGVKKVVFDRRRYKYHGRVKALAEGARNSGLQF